MFYNTKHTLDISTVISIKKHISQMNFTSVIRQQYKNYYVWSERHRGDKDQLYPVGQTQYTSYFCLIGDAEPVFKCCTFKASRDNRKCAVYVRKQSAVENKCT